MCVIICRPSTFAQATKLRRTAAAKEKELAKCQSQLRLITKFPPVNYLLLSIIF